MNTAKCDYKEIGELLLSIKTNTCMMTSKEMLILYNAVIKRKMPATRLIHTKNTHAKCVYFLENGLIKISNNDSEGEEIIKYFVKPGTIFGELNLLDYEEDKHEIAVAMRNSEISCIPVEALKQLMSIHPELRNIIDQSIGRRIRRMEQRMLGLMFKNVKDRILDFLKEFVVDFGHPVAGGYSADFFITHDDIARITGTSRQSVTASLVDFKKKGLIDYDTRCMSVFNLARS